MTKLLLTGIAALFLATGTAHVEPIEPGDVAVIDGDTIAVYGMRPDVRLVGFNAPETSNVCEAERQLGLRASRRLLEIVRDGHLDFVYVQCSCPASTLNTRFCNYGRDCGTLKSNGRDVGAILIEEGLAVPFMCGATSCPKTPRPWCNTTMAPNPSPFPMSPETKKWIEELNRRSVHK